MLSTDHLTQVHEVLVLIVLFPNFCTALILYTLLNPSASIPAWYQFLLLPVWVICWVGPCLLNSVVMIIAVGSGVALEKMDVLPVSSSMLEEQMHLEYIQRIQT